MGKPVTLDSDDVELLLNVTGIIKNVERALNPVEKTGEVMRLRYTAAHANIATKWRQALRADNPDYAFTRVPPTKRDIELLGLLDECGGSHCLVGPNGLQSTTAAPVSRDWMKLEEKRLIALGQHMEGHKWSDEENVDIKTKPETWARMTEKGYKALDEWQTLKDAEVLMVKAPVKPVTLGEITSFIVDEAKKQMAQPQPSPHNPADPFGDELRENGRKLARPGRVQAEIAEALSVYGSGFLHSDACASRDGTSLCTCNPCHLRATAKEIADSIKDIADSIAAADNERNGSNEHLFPSVVEVDNELARRAQLCADGGVTVGMVEDQKALSDLLPKTHNHGPRCSIYAGGACDCATGAGVAKAADLHHLEKVADKLTQETRLNPDIHAIWCAKVQRDGSECNCRVEP